MARSSSRRNSRRSKGRRSRSRSPEVTRWFGVDRRVIIGGAVVLLLIFLFVPMYSAVKVIEVTETAMVTVEKQVPETVTEDVPTKVYVGYLQEQGQTYGGNMPVIIVYGSQPMNNGWAGASADSGPSYGPSYNTYGSSGRRYQVDVSDEIVDFQQANGPDGSLTITLTNADGKSTVYRYIDQYDLTKTGEIEIPTTVTRTKIVSEQEPQQVTREQVVPIRVNLIQLLSANLREQ
jgi:hypothetical protein